ncbi:hypothetical protein [Pseudomonas sp. NPDC079086]|uniref:hypothetical protein n=1 Tax=unclassified Pseudomonas TaxID=196821 RepID=UPI0037C66C39
MSEKAAVIKGHGHVTPNADGSRTRCGGPTICKVCKAELAALKAQPSALVPDRDGLVAAVCVLKSQGLGNLAAAVSDALTVLDGATIKQSLTVGGVDERAAFIRDLKLEGRVYYDANTHQWLPTRDSVEGFQLAQRVTACWVGWVARAALSAPSHGEQVRGSSDKYFIATQGLNRSTGQWETVRGDFYLADANPLPAWSDVIAERQRQISAEGWTPEHDDAHSDGALAKAAACYAANAGDQRIPKTWPWQARFWKPGTARRMLVKSGALILAEIERLDRAAAPSSGSQEQGE